MIVGHGDDGYLYSNIRANFSSNVYQQLDLSGLAQHLRQHISTIHNYPEPAAQSLVSALALQHNILPSQLCAANGATEAIYLIAQAFRGATTTIIAPVFSEYADACSIQQHKLTHLFDLANFNGEADLCWLCNPNNPTGKVYSTEQLFSLIEKYTNTCFVIDQSYAAFAPHTWLNLAKIVTYPNVIVLYSMTKHFAIAGLRLGYFVAHADLVERISVYRMPWSVNSLAIVAGHYLLSHYKSLPFNLANLLADTKELQQQLAELEGIQVLPSHTHFFLVKLLNGASARMLKEYLAQKHQLLIRDASNFVGLDYRYFRVASQNVGQNEWLVNGIKAWLQES